VGASLAKEIQDGCERLNATNKVAGIVLDLRYADGADYEAAAGAVDLFVSKPASLLYWGSKTVSSHEKSDAIHLPVAVLVNGETSGAAEVLAALFRETSSGLILGSPTAGRATATKEFPLSGGAELLIATGPVVLGNGVKLSSGGVKPDILVPVPAGDERAYYANAFALPPDASGVASASGMVVTNASSDTNQPHVRFDEAELVREHRAGTDVPMPFTQSTGGAAAAPEKPLVSDPVLSRALDLLKGLAVVRQWHS
jgi:hypothetical protein